MTTTKTFHYVRLHFLKSYKNQAIVRDTDFCNQFSISLLGLKENHDVFKGIKEERLTSC